MCHGDCPKYAQFRLPQAHPIPNVRQVNGHCLRLGHFRSNCIVFVAALVLISSPINMKRRLPFPNLRWTIQFLLTLPLLSAGLSAANSFRTSRSSRHSPACLIRC